MLRGDPAMERNRARLRAGVSAIEEKDVFCHTVGRILELAASAVPNRISVTLGDESLTFGQSEDRANRMANALCASGLRHGDRLVFFGAVSTRQLDVFFASQKLGVVFVPLKSTLSIPEAQRVVEYIRPALLVADAGLSDQAVAIAEKFSVRVATVNGRGADFCLEDAFAKASELPARTMVADEDIHAIFLTSGSTGDPKGVMVSHRASWNRSFNAATRTATSGGRGEVNMFPLFHWAGWNFILAAWTHMRTIHLTASVDANSLAQLFDRWAPETMYAIPAIWERLIGYERAFERASLKNARTGTYRFEPELIERIKGCFPAANCTSSWGATELGTGAMISDTEIMANPYSVGLPGPGVELRIVDGELQGRTDQMMTGYFNLPEVTAATVVDGWYLTGDLAEKDDTGLITITGRRREVIRSGGETIAPAEVEEALRTVPGFADVAVIGLPDLRWGETVCAAVVLETGVAPPSVAELSALLAGKLAPFKHPRRICQVDSLPRTAATGQIQRSLVREQISSQLALR